MCGRCGVCQSVCPVFSRTRLESDVARGRLQFIGNLGSHLERDPAEVLARLEKCVQCASCESACPPDIPIMDIYRQAREIAAGILAEKGWAKTAPDVMRPLPSQPGKGLAVARRCVAYTPMPVSPRALLFPGCLAQSLYPEMLDACVAVLRHHGFGVGVPANLACCGKSCADGADMDALADSIRQNLDILGPLDFDYLLSPCASCTSTIRTLWPKFADVLPLSSASRLADICGRTMDISAFLVDVAGLEATEPHADATPVTYHDPCQLGKRQGKVWEPRTVLMANPDYEFLEMPDAGQCCGCGGRFFTIHPELSEAIGRDKLVSAESTGAKVVATSCSWCRWQLERLTGDGGMLARHPVEIYAASLSPGKRLP